MAEALREATDASYAAVGTPGRGHHPHRRPGRRRRRRVAPSPPGAEPAPATSSPPPRRPPARRWPARPSSCRCCATAGVVDAGGRGLSVILDAAETVLTGRRPVAGDRPDRRAHASRSRPPRRHGRRPHRGRPVVRGDVPARRRRSRIPRAAHRAGRRSATRWSWSAATGLWNVHVHVDDVGAAIEAGIEAGRPHRVRVTHFAEQVEAAAGHRDRRTERRRAAGSSPSPPGPGLAAAVRRGRRGRGRGRPGPPAVDRACCSRRSPAAGAAEVVVLPNDPDSVRVAAGRRPHRRGGPRHPGRGRSRPQAQVQGLAALAVHEPGRSFDQDVLEMTATARHARHGAVTVAARRAITMAGPCEPGDVLGVDRRRLRRRRRRPVRVATEVLERLLGGGGELVTIVAGAEGPPDLAARARGRGWRSSTRMSTSWCTTVARSATRSSCPSSERTERRASITARRRPSPDRVTRRSPPSSATSSRSASGSSRASGCARSATCCTTSPAATSRPASSPRSSELEQGADADRGRRDRPQRGQQLHRPAHRPAGLPARDACCRPTARRCG